MTAIGWRVSPPLSNMPMATWRSSTGSTDAARRALPRNLCWRKRNEDHACHRRLDAEGERRRPNAVDYGGEAAGAGARNPDSTAEHDPHRRQTRLPRNTVGVV